MFQNKTILVTGGTGSFGRHFCKTLLENYKPPDIDPSIDEELRSYIEKRKEELPNTEA